MKKNLHTKMGKTVRMSVALLAALALMAGLPQTTMAKKKASDPVEAKADSEKSKPSKAEETTAKKSSADSKKKDGEKSGKEDASVEKLVAELTPTQKKKLLALLNDGDAKALAEISGVGKVRGEAIAKARPFESLEDVRKVKGMGDKVFADVLAHGKTMAGESPKSSTKKEADKKPTNTKSKKSA